MAGIWQDYGRDMAGLWQGSGRAMAGLWQGYGRAMAGLGPDSSSMIYFREFADPILNILFQ